LIAQEKNLNTYRIRRGRLEGNEWESLRQATEWLNELEHEHRFHISEKPAVNAAYIHAVCKRLKSRGLLDIVFVDYVQLMSAPGKSIYEQVTNSSKGLKQIALDLNVPVVAAAQLRRDAEARRPRLSDLKESGSLEQDADVILFIWHEGDPVNHDIDTSIRVGVAKHRNGPIGDLMKNGNSLVQFRKSCTKFEDCAL
jgi:replicative DNA helicase